MALTCSSIHADSFSSCDILLLLPLLLPLFLLLLLLASSVAAHSHPTLTTPENFWELGNRAFHDGCAP